MFDITKRITNVNLMYSILPYQRLGDILLRLVWCLLLFYTSLSDLQCTVHNADMKSLLLYLIRMCWSNYQYRNCLYLATPDWQTWPCCPHRGACSLSRQSHSPWHQVLVTNAKKCLLGHKSIFQNPRTKKILLGIKSHASWE